MSCSMRPPCSCHETVCTVCDCLHDPCGWMCAAERWIRLQLRRLRNALT